MRFISIFSLAVLGVLPPAVPASSAAPAAPRRPNVVIILPDDVSFDDFSYHNSGGPLPAGPALIQTWLLDGAGNEIAGAYYTYVQRNEL